MPVSLAIKVLDRIIKTIRVVGIKKMCVFRWQIEYKHMTHGLSRPLAVGKLAGWRTMKRRLTRVRIKRRRTMKRIGQNSCPTIQFIIYPAHLPAPFKLIRGEPKAREHDHQDEAVPDLQPPLDGFENHFWGTSNIQHPTSNAQFEKCAPSTHWMFSVGCWLLDVFTFPQCNSRGRGA